MNTIPSLKRKLQMVHVAQRRRVFDNERTTSMREVPHPASSTSTPNVSLELPSEFHSVDIFFAIAWCRAP